MARATLSWPRALGKQLACRDFTGLRACQAHLPGSAGCPWPQVPVVET